VATRNPHLDHSPHEDSPFPRSSSAPAVFNFPSVYSFYRSPFIPSQNILSRNLNASFVLPYVCA
jgi:hypothetical protein